GASAVYFDIDSSKQDGMAEATGWVIGGDGLLAIDLNYDGIINNAGELFGDQSGYDNGFQALASYDSNSDGYITAEDQVWGSLLMWVDQSADGVSEEDELHTLDDLGITEISTSYTEVSYTIAD